MSTYMIARVMISFSWIYHGLFPKLFHIAPLEKAMTASIGLSEAASLWITRSAGVGEIVFGCCLFIFYKKRWLIYLNIIALFALLLFVTILYPVVLIEAFNPVTTNLSVIALSFVLLNELKDKK